MRLGLDTVTTRLYSENSIQMKHTEIYSKLAQIANWCSMNRNKKVNVTYLNDIDQTGKLHTYAANYRLSGPDADNRVKYKCPVEI